MPKRPHHRQGEIPIACSARRSQLACSAGGTVPGSRSKPSANRGISQHSGDHRESQHPPQHRQVQAVEQDEDPRLRRVRQPHHGDVGGRRQWEQGRWGLNSRSVPWGYQHPDVEGSHQCSLPSRGTPKRSTERAAHREQRRPKQLSTGRIACTTGDTSGANYFMEEETYTIQMP